jgi:hypothetical protein
MTYGIFVAAALNTGIPTHTDANTPHVAKALCGSGQIARHSRQPMVTTRHTEHDIIEARKDCMQQADAPLAGQYLRSFRVDS